MRATVLYASGGTSRVLPAFIPDEDSELLEVSGFPIAEIALLDR